MSSDAPVQPQVVISENQPLPVELHPNIEHIITEDDTPVDGQFCEKQHRLLVEILYSSWRPGEPFVAMTNVGLFFAIRTPPFVPDVLVSLGVESPADPFPKRNRSYFIWEYGKPPDVVVEVVSNDEGGEDTVKLQGYAKIGVPYYIIYDPEEHTSSKRLRIYRNAGGRYQLDESETMVLDTLGLGVTLWSGSYEDMTQQWLRWTSRDGTLLPTAKELADSAVQRAEAEARRAEAESKRAEAESKRADEESKRAHDAQQEAARLREKLKQLGIEL
jgi:Uma2 family endonuclease